MKTGHFKASDLLEFAQAERKKERERTVRILKEAALDMDSLTVNNFLKEAILKINGIGGQHG